MNTPTPHPPEQEGRITTAAQLLKETAIRHGFIPAPPTHDLNGVAETQGPLVRQPAPAARLAGILHHSAMDLWDVCTLTDAPQMYEEARAIASRILAACPID